MSPPGGVQARTGISGAPVSPATSAANRSARTLPGEPLTPAMTRSVLLTLPVPATSGPLT